MPRSTFPPNPFHKPAPKPRFFSPRRTFPSLTTTSSVVSLGAASAAVASVAIAPTAGRGARTNCWGTRRRRELALVANYALVETFIGK
eukprot:31183-Pelagococcus_subviridis.AAC.3